MGALQRDRHSTSFSAMDIHIHQAVGRGTAHSSTQEFRYTQMGVLSAQAAHGLHFWPVVPPVQQGPSPSVQSHSPSSAVLRLGGYRVCMPGVADMGQTGEHSGCAVMATSICSDWDAAENVCPQ